MTGQLRDARPGETARLVRVWLPTAFGASMLVLEIPLVYAAIARTTGGAQALAATGMCVSLLVVVNTPALALTPLVTVENQRRGLRRYAMAVGVVGSALLVALAVLPPATRGLTSLLPPPGVPRAERRPAPGTDTACTPPASPSRRVRSASSVRTRCTRLPTGRWS